jgi:lipopolysaccharide export system protein LptA
MSKVFTKNRRTSVRASHVIAALITMMIAIATPFAAALEDDRAQPLRVVADSAEHNEVSGVTVYTGNVVITQGSMRIEADIVTLKGVDNRINNMIADGKPARLQQQPKPEDAMMYARAQRIIYYVDDDRVRLIDKASIEQEDSIVNSDEIEYLVKDRIVKAHGGIEGKTGNGVKPKRVEFIYTPQKNPDASSKDAASKENVPQKNTQPQKSTSPQKKDTP